MCMVVHQVQQAVAQAAAQQLQQLQARAGAVQPPTTGTSPTYKYIQGSCTGLRAYTEMIALLNDSY